MHLIGNNRTAVTVSIRARQSPDQNFNVNGVSIYGATLAPVAGGVDMGTISWDLDCLIVEARGLASGSISLVDGTISVEEVSAKEAFCSTDGEYTAPQAQSMWFEYPRSNNPPAVVASIASNTITINAPWPDSPLWKSGSAVLVLSSGTYPTGLLPNVVYFLVGANSSALTFQLAQTAGGTALTLGTSWSGTLEVYDAGM